MIKKQQFGSTQLPLLDKRNSAKQLTYQLSSELDKQLHSTKNVQRKNIQESSLQKMQTSNPQHSSKNIFQEFSDKLDKQQIEIESRNKIINDLESTINVLKNEYLAEKKQSQEKSQKLGLFQQEKNSLEQRVQNYKIKMEEQQTQILLYEQELKNNSKEKTVEQPSNSTRFKGQIDELQKQLQQAEQDKQQNMEGSKELKKKEEENIQLQNQMTELKTQYENLLNENKKLDDEQKKLNNLCQQGKLDADKQKHQLMDEISKLQQQLKINSNKTTESMSTIQNSFESQKKQLEEQIAQQELQLDQLKRDTETIKKEFDSLKRDHDLLNEKYQVTESQNQDYSKARSLLKLQYEELEKKNILSEQNFKQSNQNLQQQINQKNKEIADLNKQLEDIQKDKVKLKSQEQQVKSNIQQLEKAEVEIMKNLKCNFCGKIIVEPVTIIPCGHNYCFQCKKAYQKECIKCGPKVKIEAMYRNELMDDILGMAKLLQSTKQQLQSYII